MARVLKQHISQRQGGLRLVLCRVVLAVGLTLGMSLVGSLAVPGKAAHASHASAKRYKIGYDLHILIPFTEQIAAGAKDAAADLGMDINVVGPPAFSAPTEITDFNGFVQ